VVGPFSGAGTVPLEAALQERNVFASDISPYARILTRGKLSVLKREEDALNMADHLNESFLARYLTEEDTTREPLARNARGLYEEIDNIDSEFNLRQKDISKAELTSPFDFLSCEQLGESRSLLRALYSGLFLGLSWINGKNNLVLTGRK